jgi:deoxyribose-phosphate aldolase
MKWFETIQAALQAIKPIDVTPAVMQRLIPFIDLTSLNDTDSAASIAAFIEKAQTPYGPVAAVCVYPQFVSLAATEFAHSPVKVATVVNFPAGNTPLDDVLIVINDALQDGAQEIDVVFPYARFLAGEQQYVHTFVTACKAACGTQVMLKVILETGALTNLEIIAEASRIALTAGADFIKTSTGKIPTGATLEAAAVMLLIIKQLSPELKRPLGIKLSGGIREWQQAAQYLELAENIMGRMWPVSATFRLGVSKLL